MLRDLYLLHPSLTPVPHNTHTHTHTLTHPIRLGNIYLTNIQGKLYKDLDLHLHHITQYCYSSNRPVGGPRGSGRESGRHLLDPLRGGGSGVENGREVSNIRYTFIYMCIPGRDLTTSLSLLRHTLRTPPSPHPSKDTPSRRLPLFSPQHRSSSLK